MEPDLPQQDLNKILQSALCSEGSVDPTQLQYAALTARGLLAGDVLRTCMHKRHRVEFGVDNITYRCKIALPFRYKDAPSESTEFGHPDVAIALTLRAYYEDGLSQDGFQKLLDRLAELPACQRTELYRTWLLTAKKECDRRSPAGETVEEAIAKRLGLPISSTSLVTEDKSVVEHLWRKLSLNMRVIETYVEEVVFPTETRQFPHKANHIETQGSKTRVGRS